MTGIGYGFSVAILTKNEEVTIERCIRSIAPYSSDIHVVDSGSTDRTVQIAQDNGASVTSHPLSPFLITDQRNWALQNLKYTNAWVLFLDADEAMTPLLADEISCRLFETQMDAYHLAPKFLYQGTWLRRYMGYPNWHPRLVRLGKASFTGGVWESFAVGVSAGYIAEPYLHYVNSKGLSDWVQRHVRYAEWEARPVRSPDERHYRARRFLRPFGILRVPVTIAYHLIWRRGFLDGGSVWSYARRQMVYQLLVVEAARERKLGDLARE